MQIRFAPKNIFDTILEWSVIPTFDLVIQHGSRGVIIVKRSIAPYRNQWALPGLRMYKPERIDDTLQRIAAQEVGLTIDHRAKVLLGQYVGKFKTEHGRQDLSTGYCVSTDGEQSIAINPGHFSDFRVIRHPHDIPHNTGAMYVHYLNIYFKLMRNLRISRRNNPSISKRTSEKTWVS